MCKIGYLKESDDLNILDSGGQPFISAERFQYMMVEKVDDIVFGFFSETESLENWDKGRLFGEQTELKWLKRNGKFDLVVINDDDDLPGGFSEYSAPKLERVASRSIFLWGEKDDTITAYFDARIPQILEYPVKSFRHAKSQLKIKVQQYRLTEINSFGEEIDSFIHRYTGLEE